MGTKRPEGADAARWRSSGSDITVSRTALLPYWPQAFSAALSGLRKLIIGCSTHTASGEWPTTVEQAGSNEHIRMARAAERMVKEEHPDADPDSRAGAGEGNRTLV